MNDRIPGGTLMTNGQTSGSGGVLPTVLWATAVTDCALQVPKVTALAAPPRKARLLIMSGLPLGPNLQDYSASGEVGSGPRAAVPRSRRRDRSTPVTGRDRG